MVWTSLSHQSLLKSPPWGLPHLDLLELWPETRPLFYRLERELFTHLQEMRLNMVFLDQLQRRILEQMDLSSDSALHPVTMETRGLDSVYRCGPIREHRAQVWANPNVSRTQSAPCGGEERVVPIKLILRAEPGEEPEERPEKRPEERSEERPEKRPERDQEIAKEKPENKPDQRPERETRKRPEERTERETRKRPEERPGERVVPIQLTSRADDRTAEEPQVDTDV